VAKRRGGLGILPFVAAFLGLLAAAGGAGAFYFYSLYDEVNEGKPPASTDTIPVLLKKVEEAQASEKKMLARWNKLAPWVLDTKYTDVKDFDTSGEEEINQKLIKPIIENLLPDEYRNDKYEAQVALIQKQPLHLITQILPAMEQERKKLEGERDNLKEHLAKTKAELEQERNSLDQQGRNLNGQIGTLQNDVAEKSRAAAAMETDLQAQISELKVRLDAGQREHRRLQDQLNKDVSRLKTENASMKEQNVRITKQQEAKAVTMEVDGEITNVAGGLRLAYVNLGRRQRLQRGMKFSVFHYGPGGVPQKKGEIEILDVQEELSKAAILSLRNERDPLVEGDLIANPIYRPNTTPNFVLCGQMRRYSNDELGRLIEETGGKIQTKVSVDTDYVVAGGDKAKYETDPNFRDAMQLGLRVMSEQDLLEFLPAVGGK